MHDWDLRLKLWWYNMHIEDYYIVDIECTQWNDVVVSVGHAPLW